MTQLSESEIKLSDITAEQIKDLLQKEHQVIFEFKGKDILVFNHNKDHFEIFYGERDLDKGEFTPSYQIVTPQYFSKDRMDDAIELYLKRLHAENHMFHDGSGEKLEEIMIRLSQKLTYKSHYDYCNAILEKFWLKVFNKTPSEMWCAGIVTAHGDKCYCSKSTWHDAGIPFHHGALLYLLTYTKEMDQEKHKSEAWVIEKYPHYLPMIQAAEQEVLAEKFPKIA